MILLQVGQEVGVFGDAICQVKDLILKIFVEEIAAVKQNLLGTIVALLVIFLEIKSICNGRKNLEIVYICVVRQRRVRNVRGHLPACACVNAFARAGVKVGLYLPLG